MTDTQHEAAERVSDERVYLIRKSGAWYRPDSAGYTNNAHEAGLYTLEEAEKITYPNGPNGPRDAMSYQHRDTVPALALRNDAGQAGVQEPEDGAAAMRIAARALDLTKQIERLFYYDHAGGAAQVRARVQAVIADALAASPQPPPAPRSAVVSEDDMASILWRTEATDAGVPQSVVDRRTRQAFDDEGEGTKDRWRKFARAALSLSAPTKQEPTGSLFGDALAAAGKSIGMSVTRVHPEPEKVAYPRLTTVRAHKHTCANVQPGSTYADKCDCGALDTAGLPISATPPVVDARRVEELGWRDMASAPLDGKHCILSVPETGGFIYSVQGAYQNGQWNAVHRDNVQPIAWMPNVLLPEHLSPNRTALKGDSNGQ